MEAFADQPADDDGTAAVLAGAIASVNAAATAAPGMLAIAGYVEAADFRVTR